MGTQSRNGMSAQPKARIVLVDDQLLFREAVPAISEEPALEVAEARDGYQAGASDRLSSELVRSHR
jgi:hypothetical protein